MKSDVTGKQVLGVSQVFVVIPALNEQANLPGLFQNLLPELYKLEVPFRIFLVDDGSTDLTVDVVRAFQPHHPIELLKHKKNAGPGAAFMTGFSRVLALAHDDDPILTLEADGTSDPTLIGPMLASFQRGNDLVLASVYHPHGSIRHAPWHRKVLSRSANHVVRRAFRMKRIHTFSSFFRIYRAGLLRQASQMYGSALMTEAGFASVVELLIKLHRLGAVVDEVPMMLDGAKRIGPSRMRIVPTLRAYGRIFRHYL